MVFVFLIILVFGFVLTLSLCHSAREGDRYNDMFYESLNEYERKDDDNEILS